MSDGVQIDLGALAREIAARISPDALVDMSDIAAMLRVAPRYVAERYVPAPGFPKPIRLTGTDGRRSHPKWFRRDIIAWLESHRDGKRKTGGRPREKIDF